MREERLQYEIVTWFHNSVPEERGTLFAIMNETNRGATKKGLGLLPGASDLGYIAVDGSFVGFELKVPGSRHDVAHLKRQLSFAEKAIERGSLAFFVFSLDHFKHIAASLTSGPIVLSWGLSRQSLDFIRGKIVEGETKGIKTVKLDWKGMS